MILGFDPDEVAALIVRLPGVIGWPSLCWTKNSFPVLKICKSRPERIPVIALTESEESIANIASSSKPSASKKLKKSDTFDPNKALGKLLDPPKYNRPS